MKRNLLPIIGLVVGIGLILVAMTDGGSIMRFWDLPSILITFFGSLAAILISFPLSTLKKVPALMRKLLVTPDDDRLALIETLTRLAKKSRTEGILSIEQDIAELENPVLIYGLQMVVDGMDIESIQEILNVELEQTEDRHSIGQEVFVKWGEYAPAFGMIGTLIGLIAMLGDLQDPSTIGTGMATALLTTFYGSFLANMVFLPLAKNLEIQTAKECKTIEMVIEGVLALQRGDNPRTIEQKLLSYLSQSDKKKDEKEELQVAEELVR